MLSETCTGWKLPTSRIVVPFTNDFLFGPTPPPQKKTKAQEVQADQTLPIGSRESFIGIILNTILCLVWKVLFFLHGGDRRS